MVILDEKVRLGLARAIREARGYMELAQISEDLGLNPELLRELAISALKRIDRSSHQLNCRCVLIPTEDDEGRSYG